MKATIIEIKARCKHPEKIKSILEKHNADFKGVDHQVDTYFKVSSGRLKLREGNIENTLIYYQRANQAGPKKSEVSFYRTAAQSGLKEVLVNALENLTKVDKKRAIYFIENVKFHVDEVQNLGSFMEIEAIDETGTLSEAILLEQCQDYLDLFGIENEDLIENSYSDLLIAHEGLSQST